MFNSISVLYSWDASSTPPYTLVVTIKNSSSHCQVSAGGQNCPQLGAVVELITDMGRRKTLIREQSETQSSTYCLIAVLFKWRNKFCKCIEKCLGSSMQQIVNACRGKVRGRTMGGGFPLLLDPCMHCFNLVNFYFRNIVSEKWVHGTQFDGKYKRLKVGIKVLAKDVWSRQEKTSTRGGCPAGLGRPVAARGRFQHPGLVRG